MDSKYQPSLHEERLVQLWERNKSFERSTTHPGEPFCIVLPPPNANADLHLGHAMYVYEDVMIRYNKLQGKNTWWIYGTDHAGIETQFVFEKHLQKQGKSRFDYDKATLFRMIDEFVRGNKNIMEAQLKKLGFGIDFSHPYFTMDPSIVSIVYRTFEQLYKDGLIYRAKRLVNYCISCGTSFSDLEAIYEERATSLWYIRYPIVGSNETITVATTRPETMLGDMAVAVNPKDKRYKKWVGQSVLLPIMNRTIPIVADRNVDPAFGTGAVKVTPAHDQSDWEIAQRHSIALIEVINAQGKMTSEAGIFAGMTITQARQAVVNELNTLGMLEKTTDHVQRVAKCYRCRRVLESLPKEQWFIKIKPLADAAVKAVKSEEVSLYPRRFKRDMTRILNNFIDWNISRQIVWGIRIPAYRCMSESEIPEDKRWFVSVDTPNTCQVCNSCSFKQDEDTFDTWFSSGQWPYATTKSAGEDVYKLFYPTTVMETGHDILRAWVARMLMLGIYTSQTVPFRTVFLHGLVRDKNGQKMSKSKGNVVNPLEVIKQFGADVLRLSLLFETKEGSDTSLTDQKLIGMRNFGNKIWNIGRFLFLAKEEVQPQGEHLEAEQKKTVAQLMKEFKQVKQKYHRFMGTYHFSQALGLMHSFIWHRFADVYIERLKESLRNGNISTRDTLFEVYAEALQMLHPFMPFETEAIWQILVKKDSILESRFTIIS